MMRNTSISRSAKTPVELPRSNSIIIQVYILRYILITSLTCPYHNGPSYLLHVNSLAHSRETYPRGVCHGTIIMRIDPYYNNQRTSTRVYGHHINITRTIFKFSNVGFAVKYNIYIYSAYIDAPLLPRGLSYKRFVRNNGFIPYRYVHNEQSRSVIAQYFR